MTDIDIIATAVFPIITIPHTGLKTAFLILNLLGVLGSWGNVVILGFFYNTGGVGVFRYLNITPLSTFLFFISIML